jgi:hypothetical protein
MREGGERGRGMGRGRGVREREGSKGEVEEGGEGE